jgi:hypothetical protein
MGGGSGVGVGGIGVGVGAARGEAHETRSSKTNEDPIICGDNIFRSMASSFLAE